MNALSSNKNQTEKIDTPPRVSNKNNLDHIVINRKMQKKKITLPPPSSHHHHHRLQQKKILRPPIVGLD